MDSDSDDQDVVYQHNDERDKLLRLETHQSSSSISTSPPLYPKSSVPIAPNILYENDANIQLELENILKDSVKFSEEVSQISKNMSIDPSSLTLSVSDAVSDDDDDTLHYISPTINKTKALAADNKKPPSKSSSSFIPDDEADFFDTTFDYTPISSSSKKKKKNI